MHLLINPCKDTGLTETPDFEPGEIVTDPTAARLLFAQCPAAAPSPLVNSPEMAKEFGIKTLSLKDERRRMGLGSFKALGAAFAIAKQAAHAVALTPETPFETALSGQTFVCASAGNHGLSLAAGARLFGAMAVVYLAETVPEDFAERLRGKGATVVREGDVYEASMAAATKAASDNGWQLLSDGSWLGYADPARDVMEGYLIMTAEVADEIDTPPTHVFLQAGVGGLAAACAGAVRSIWGSTPKLIVVEPEFAPALIESVRADCVVTSPGPVSSMGRLDCKVPSHLALRYLAREADAFMTITEDEVAQTIDLMATHDMASSPSGGAGVSGLHHLRSSGDVLGLDENARVLCYVSEGPTR